jgi:hypothetical protein
VMVVKLAGDGKLTGWLMKVGTGLMCGLMV